MADQNPDPNPLSLSRMPTNDDSQQSEELPTVRDREGTTPGAPLPGSGEQLEGILMEQGMSDSAFSLKGMLNIEVNQDQNKTPRNEEEEGHAAANVLKQVVEDIAPDKGDVGAGPEDPQIAKISVDKPKYVILKSLIDCFIGLNIFYRGARHLGRALSTFNALWSMIPRYSAWFSAAAKVGSLDAAIAADPVGGAAVSSYVTTLYDACMQLGWGGQAALGLIVAGLGFAGVQVYYRIRRGRDSMSEADKQAMEEEGRAVDAVAFSDQVEEITAAGKRVREEDKEVIKNIIMPYRRWVRAIQLQDWSKAGDETKVIIDGVSVLTHKGRTFEAVKSVLDLIPRAGSTVRQSVPAIRAYMEALQKYDQDRSNEESKKEVAEAYTNLQISLYNTAILISPINSTISTGLAGLPVAAAAIKQAPAVSGAARGAQYLAGAAGTGVKRSAEELSETMKIHGMYHQAAAKKKEEDAKRQTIETGKGVAKVARDILEGGGGIRRRRNNKPRKRKSTLRRKSTKRRKSSRRNSRKTTVRRKSTRRNSRKTTVRRKSKRLSRKLKK